WAFDSFSMMHSDFATSRQARGACEIFILQKIQQQNETKSFFLRISFNSLYVVERKIKLYI
ncbi:MAG: hypothetical protein RSC12_02840, partial [Alistipes sp.]